MISTNTYNRANLVSLYLGGKVKHFPVKNPSVTTQWYKYIFRSHDTIYTVAEMVFGRGMGYMWTYIADNNIPKHPDSWGIGDTIKLPIVILKDNDTK